MTITIHVTKKCKSHFIAVLFFCCVGCSKNAPIKSSGITESDRITSIANDSVLVSIDTSVTTGLDPVQSATSPNNTNEPVNINGLWNGVYIDSSVICMTLMRVGMNVEITGDKFMAVITATDVPAFPVRTLDGIINADTSEVTLVPDGSIVFENPWIISGNKIKGAIKTDLPIPPDTIIVKRWYEFTKK